MKNMHSLIAMGVIKSLPSEYGGCVFRSRLEARTAYYFDLLGIKWEYEPEGYALPCGNYAPDFLCTAIDKYDKKHQFFIEVKPNYEELKSYETRLRQLCQASKTDVYYFPGFPEATKDGEYLTNPAICFTYNDASAMGVFSPHGESKEWADEEHPNRGTLPNTEKTVCHSAFFTMYAFVIKEWGEPFCGDDYWLFDDDDVDCIKEAKFLKFDRAGRAMLGHQQHKNYGIYAG